MQFNAMQKIKCFDAATASLQIKLDDKLKINENIFLVKHKKCELFEVDHYYYLLLDLMVLAIPSASLGDPVICEHEPE